jgi:hypothetical protein
MKEISSASGESTKRLARSFIDTDAEIVRANLDSLRGCQNGGDRAEAPTAAAVEGLGGGELAPEPPSPGRSAAISYI